MAQLDGKWVKADTLDDTKVRLTNDAYLRARNNANSADINLLKITTGDIALFGVKPQFSGSPSQDDDLVNRGYVLGALAGVRDPKDACRCASTANIDLATGTLLTIDGVSTAAGDRVLVKDQTAGDENGIYIAGVGTWARSTDADVSAEVTQGMSSMIVEGTLHARKIYVLTTGDPIVLDTTALVFAQAPNPANFLIPQSIVNTLDGTDISNGYIDLAHEAEAGSVNLTPIGGPQQQNGQDFTLSVVSNVTRITFANDLSTQAASGDLLQVKYSYATT